MTFCVELPAIRQPQLVRARPIWLFFLPHANLLSLLFLLLGIIVAMGSVLSMVFFSCGFSLSDRPECSIHWLALWSCFTSDVGFTSLLPLLLECWTQDRFSTYAKIWKSIYTYSGNPSAYQPTLLSIKNEPHMLNLSVMWLLVVKYKYNSSYLSCQRSRTLRHWLF